MRILGTPNSDLPPVRRRSLQLVTAGALLALTLTGCGGPDDEADPPPAPRASATDSGAPGSGPAQAASRLTGVPNASGVCLDGFANGTLAFTGPELRVVGGPITVTHVALDREGDGSIRLTGSAAALYTIDPVAHPGIITADSLAGLKPTGRPYVHGSQGPLVGTEFDAGRRGLVPLIEAKVRWPQGRFPEGTGFTITQPDLTITYTDSDGDPHSVTEKTGVTIHSAQHGCEHD